MTPIEPSQTDTSPSLHYCPRCGTPLTAGVDICPSCGQTLCPSCGAQVDENATHCPACGVALELACPNCGASLQPEDVRCARCGTTFQVGAPQSIVAVTTPQFTQAEQVHQAYLYALNQLQAKADPQQVEEQLVVSGLARSTVSALMNTLLVTRRQADRAAGRHNMLIGGLWIVGGLVITLVGQTLAQERGGSYYILWGAVIIGAILFVRGLGQFLNNAPARSTLEAQPEIDPLMAKNNYVWPMPKQKKSSWLGVIAFLALMAMLSLSSLGTPLINKSAAQVNLTAADLGSEFLRTDEGGPEAFNDKDLRDANIRTLTGDNTIVRSTVLIWNKRSGDSPNALLAAFDKPIRQDASVPVSFGSPHAVSIGKQGALESFQFKTNGRKMHGHLLTFIRENVVVLVLEIGPKGGVTEDLIQSHARLIDKRLQ